MEKLTKMIPQDSGSMGHLIDSVLAPLPHRWRNWVVRGVFTIIMVSLFCFIVNRGPTWLMALVFAIQFKCFQEIISIGLAVYRMYDFPWFRALSWYFLLTSNYFFFGESLIDYWAILLRKDNFLHYLVAYHRLISFGLYCVGFVWFVLSLKKGYYMRQFSLVSFFLELFSVFRQTYIFLFQLEFNKFAWTHITLLLIVSQSFFIIQNIFQGTIWFLAPVAMIICCDVMSYMFGFFWGKTPLIKLSPKKTWEGFIGGAFSTVIFGIMIPYFLYSRPFFVCPVEDYYIDNTNCTIPTSFQLREFTVPRPVSWIFKILRCDPHIYIFPFIGHAIAMALFASLLGPFGGFFASGFKRAFKIKDFGDVIPGHGGLMDRFDCQLLMGTFVNVYIHTFIRVPNPARLVTQILWLQPEDQLTVYNSLQEELTKTGLLVRSIGRIGPVNFT
uniref:Phosphatidate cytidylyltransferase n=1 Tax=Heterorhabditis bacteriophora TaxID=37862 RepID=A0A1I7XBJ8_HETBA